MFYMFYMSIDTHTYTLYCKTCPFTQRKTFALLSGWPVELYVYGWRSFTARWFRPNFVDDLLLLIIFQLMFGCCFSAEMRDENIKRCDIKGTRYFHPDRCHCQRNENFGWIEGDVTGEQASFIDSADRKSTRLGCTGLLMISHESVHCWARAQATNNEL